RVGYDASTLSDAFKAQLQALNAGEYLTDSFTYAIRLSNGTLSWTTATVQFAGANDAPHITSDANASESENTAATHVVYTATATDPDAGTTLKYSITGGADSALFNIDSSTGAVTFKTSPNFEAPADHDGNNVYDIVVTASDGSLSDSKAVSINV